MTSTRLLASAAIALALSACSAATSTSLTTSANTTLATAKADVQEAITFYGVAKGIAQVAELADPTLAPTIDKAVAVLDPIAATATAALADATADAPTLEALAVSLSGQAQALETTAAPAIKAVPSK
jgi:hypothetical protein